MEAERIVKAVSEYGLVGGIDSTSRQFRLLSPFWKESFPSYTDFLTKYGLTPVCTLIPRSEPPSGADPIVNILRDDCSSAMDTEIDVNQRFMALSTDRSSLWPVTSRLIFYLGAARYHFARLVHAYCDVAEQYAYVLGIPGSCDEHDSAPSQGRVYPPWVDRLPVCGVEVAVLSSGFAETIFYEMFALLGTLRATLDALVPVLVRQRGVRLPRGAQRSFHALHKRLSQADLPQPLAAYIRQQWEAWISDLIDYRDTAFHYEVLSASLLPYLLGVRAGKRVVAIRAWLPDNPSARSPKAFTFAKQIEYLSYGRKVYLATLDLLQFFLDQFESLSGAEERQQ